MTSRVISRLTRALFCLSFVAASSGGAVRAQTLEPPAHEDLASLRAADADYQRYAETRDRIRFRSLLAADAVFLAGEVHRGLGPYLRAWDPQWNAQNEFSYQGEVLDATVAESGEIGFTVGRAETRFHSQVESTDQVVASEYLTVWRRTAGSWRVAASGPLVVHATLGQAREARAGLMTAWPDLTERFDAAIEIRWAPETTVRAGSGELAYVLGTYEARFGDEPTTGHGAGGTGFFLAVWRRDPDGRWQLVAESFTPPAGD